jgi:lysyl-tRNA synthetase class 2
MLNWKPTASLEAIRARAQLYADIRSFFAKRDVLEVDTPLLCEHAVTDLHIQAIPALYSDVPTGMDAKTYYLQTSPEFAMKRLLSAGMGSMYQLCKAFRNGEQGRLHNPEFTMLEWYRVGWDHHQLMGEIDELLNFILKTKPAKRLSYQALFLEHLNFDPHTVSLEELSKIAEQAGVTMAVVNKDELTKDDWLNLLMTHVIEPKLKGSSPFFIYDYPVSQAALAKIRPLLKDKSAIPPIMVAERFEVYVDGLELANGYHELCDAATQLQRFQQDIQHREEKNLPYMKIDNRFIQAMCEGLPACAGVALGVDRLLMLRLKADKLEEVLSFPIEIA